MKKILLLSSALFAGSIVHADAGIGFGVGYTFGDGFVVGPKVFTKDKEEKLVASVGIDYAIASSSFRPNVGVSYLFKEDAFADLNIGYILKSKNVTYGGSVGYTETEPKDEKIEYAPG